MMGKIKNPNRSKLWVLNPFGAIKLWRIYLIVLLEVYVEDFTRVNQVKSLYLYTEN